MRSLQNLFKNDSGSVIVEFALLGPVLIGMLFGVLQIGLGMQNYNAIRGASADAARVTVIAYQQPQTLTESNKLTNSQIEASARSIAIAPPYGLIPTRLTVRVVTAPTQRVTGATELTLTTTYNIPTVLSVFGIRDIPLTYTRPIFVRSS